MRVVHDLNGYNIFEDKLKSERLLDEYVYLDRFFILLLIMISHVSWDFFALL